MELHTVVEWAGHTDSTMILKIYDEVSDNKSQIEAEKLIGKAFGSNEPPAQDKGIIYLAQETEIRSKMNEKSDIFAS